MSDRQESLLLNHMGTAGDTVVASSQPRYYRPPSLLGPARDRLRDGQAALSQGSRVRDKHGSAWGISKGSPPVLPLLDVSREAHRPTAGQRMKPTQQEAGQREKSPGP